ncbi:MAG: hypothetical protein ABUT39_26640 [Acidobacteriota bacterium]
MQTLQKIARPAFALILSLIAVTSLAWAAPQRHQFQDPESRMAAWRQGFQLFVDRHPDLTSEQLLAIQNLADIDDAGSFEAYLDPVRREALLLGLREVGRVLPHADYLKLLRSFGDLRLWLVSNSLATQMEANVPNCNCTYSWHCQSGTCNDVACELNGTTHTGVCASGSQGKDPNTDF